MCSLGRKVIETNEEMVIIMDRLNVYYAYCIIGFFNWRNLIFIIIDYLDMQNNHSNGRVIDVKKCECSSYSLYVSKNVSTHTECGNLIAFYGAHCSFI